MRRPISSSACLEDDALNSIFSKKAYITSMTSVTYKQVPYFVVEGNNKIGIIIIQEWWGLNQHMKNLCARFSRALGGATAICPDLYRGKVATKGSEANHLMSSLDWPGAVEDIRHAAEYLMEKGCGKIGVVGFCMGGALAIAGAAHVKEIDAGVCFYGIPPAQLADPASISIPMQYHFGDKDMSPGFSDIKACDGLRDKIKAAGKVVEEIRHEDEEFHQVSARHCSVQEFHRYKNGDHAFFNEEAPHYPYNEKVAKLAEMHTLSFFKEFLA